ncbi:MAG: heme-binding protein [Anaerolineaceae bacterium]|nr:heme-binding protein [Anaerolineaceae bacterium]
MTKCTLSYTGRQGTCPVNDAWIKHKIRLAKYIEHNSFNIGQFLKSEGESIDELFLLPESEFAPHGGCFPFIIRCTGVVGAIAVFCLA